MSTAKKNTKKSYIYHENLFSYLFTRSRTFKALKKSKKSFVSKFYYKDTISSQLNLFILRMGKVASKVVNFAKNVVSAIVTSKIGATAILIVSGVLLGPIGVAGAAALEKLATDQKIESLKKQIKSYIDSHQSQINQAQSLQGLLEKDFFDQATFDGIVNLGSEIKGNLGTMFKDQQQKIQALKNIQWVHGSKSQDFGSDQTKVLTQNLMNLGRFALDVIGIASGIASGNVLSFGLGVMDLAMLTFTNIKGIYTNIDEISKLEDKKKDIEEYFKPGGQFDKHMMMTVNYTYDMVSNLCTVGLLWNSLVNELKAWFQMLKIILPAAQRSVFQNLLDQLNKSPIDEPFLLKIQQLQKKTRDIVGNNDGPVVKIHKLFELLNNFQNQNKVESVFNKIRYILQIFSNQSASYAQLKDYIKGFNDISFLISQNAHLFNYYSPSLEDSKKEDLDKKILQIIQSRVTVSQKVPEQYREKIRNLKIVMIVSSCVDNFYAEDPSGLRLKGYQLKPFVSNKGYIRILDSSTGSFGANVIALPRPMPQFPEQIKKYEAVQQYLYNKLKQKKRPSPVENIENYDICMIMNTTTYKVQNQDVNRISLFKRIQHNKRAQEYYEQLNETVDLNVSQSRLLNQQNAVGMLELNKIDNIDQIQFVQAGSGKNVKILVKNALLWVWANIDPSKIRQVRLQSSEDLKQHDLILGLGRPRQNVKYIYPTKALSQSILQSVVKNKRHIIFKHLFKHGKEVDQKDKINIAWIIQN